ncbi:universal stress protein [Nannocystis radixulma]|uniref:Universal stress protein n=1 Tax=Nannocystis radixulma TaxID=2995305 RepID=A0ABT5B690_9BACT|nr:universal stress protein [Nannocystis radixulma]MDC0669611.1 universal stress protein [Nannocystis radixulma]
MTPARAPFTKILVPVDFSPASDEHIAAGQAVEVDGQYIEFSSSTVRSVVLAADLARASLGTVILLHVTPALNYSTMYAGNLSVGLSSQVLTDVHEAAQKTSKAALEVIAQRHCSGVQVVLEARPGVAVSVIIEESERKSADLVVLAASGRSRVARFFVGSTADRVIREAICPVLVIPALHE